MKTKTGTVHANAESGVLRTLQRGLIACIVLMSLSLSYSTLFAEHKILIADFNRDCAPDTLCGDVNGDTVIPTHIRWGDHAPCPPEGDPFPDSLRHAQTWLKLPPWLCMKVIATLGNLNPAQDTTDDLTLLLTGKTADTSGWLDSTRAIVLFGRHGLDTLDTLNLCLVTSATLTTPFAAMKLSSSNFTSPFEMFPGLNGVILSELTLPTAKEGAGPEAPARTSSIRASISPTPSRDFALLTIEGLREEETDITIVDARGRRINRFTLRGSPYLEHQLDLRSLAAGRYSILISSHQPEPTVLPLFIIR